MIKMFNNLPCNIGDYVYILFDYFHQIKTYKTVCIGFQINNRGCFICCKDIDKGTIFYENVENINNEFFFKEDDFIRSLEEKEEMYEID